MLRLVVPGGAGGVMVPPDFGRSVNPNSTKLHQIILAPRIFRPSDGPGAVGKLQKSGGHYLVFFFSISVKSAGAWL